VRARLRYRDPMKRSACARPLVINSETIRVLDRLEIERVRGGDGGPPDTGLKMCFAVVPNGKP